MANDPTPVPAPSARARPGPSRLARFARSLRNYLLLFFVLAIAGRRPLPLRRDAVELRLR